MSLLTPCPSLSPRCHAHPLLGVLGGDGLGAKLHPKPPPRGVRAALQILPPRKPCSKSNRNSFRGRILSAGRLVELHTPTTRGCTSGRARSPRENRAGKMEPCITGQALQLSSSSPERGLGREGRNAATCC